MKAPYQTRQIERIVASALARRFASQVSEAQAAEILEKQEKANDAQHDFRMTVEKTVDDIMQGIRR